ncbi:MAG TPA: M48 family metallopeptidase [Fimbriimonadaceae bacterium]|mgnify:CR=1 FL=1|nr:M48 family metallopeptidase [Fimbriimonadaceae bacterium]HRJ95927.1 M48 family metallopeptidase [Fimbriimonadaceae bacterium]
MAARKRFPGISSDAFVSENDRRALAALKRVPLLPKIVQKFYEVGLDRWFYCYNMSMSVRCGPKQYRTLYEIMRESCAVLDMPEPELYVSSNPFPNAYTSGVERPYVTLRSSIIDTLSDEQLYHLMGHELGHVKAGHTLYKSVASVIAPLLELIGRRTFGLGDAASIALVMALSEWYRQAELSADRAGLLVSQSLDLSIDANLALCAGPNRLSHEMSREAFMDQARAYQDMSALDSIGKVVIFLLMGATYTHPMPVHRTQELERWVLTGAFERIMQGDYPRSEKAA